MFYQFNAGLFNRPPFWQNKAKFPNDLNGEKVWPVIVGVAGRESPLIFSPQRSELHRPVPPATQGVCSPGLTSLVNWPMSVM
jgi:hypothetical protein